MKKMKSIGIIIILLLFIAYSRSGSKEVMAQKKDEKRGVFFSYIELENYIKNDDIAIMKKNIDKAIDNISKMNLNMIVLQVRSASDAIYESTIFPWSVSIGSEEGVKSFDVLDYFLRKAHKKEVMVYAWINPY